MKKILLIIITLSLVTSCVSKKVYTELEGKYNKLRDNNSSLFDHSRASMQSDQKISQNRGSLTSGGKA